MRMNVAIIGAGRIGFKRAQALRKFENCQLVVVADVDRAAAESLAKEFGGDVETDWERVVDRNDVDVVVVSTYNKYLAPISLAAIKNRKHVLCEKPLGRNVRESCEIYESAKSKNVVLKTGFNHRYHPAIAKAKELLVEGRIGKICFLRCRYGHGGRPGYDEEWRANKNLCGGGELLDQGVHVVDLFRYYAGDFTDAFGYTPTYFWNMDVEDNAFAFFRNKGGIVASMHTSWTQWKNLFSFEVFGCDGYLVIEGLGGSYGTETLRIARRRLESGTPDEDILEFPGPDISWKKEWAEFISAIDSGAEPIGSGWDGYQANRMIAAVYESAKTGNVVQL